MYGSVEKDRLGGMTRMDSVKMFGPQPDDESAFNTNTAHRDYIKTDADAMQVQELPSPE